MGDPKGLETRLPETLDKPVIVFGLLQEAEEALKRSHGVDNKITRSVMQQRATITEGVPATGIGEERRQRQWTLMRTWAAEVMPMHLNGPSAHERIMGRK